MSTTSPQALRDRQEQNIWQELRERKCEVPKKEVDLWRPGSPSIEATALFRLVGRNGDSIEDLRRLISISAREEAELRELAAFSSPTVACGIERMISFRRQVLLHFDDLVENAHRGDSSSPFSA